MKAAKISDYDKEYYDAEFDLRTLIDAEKIKKDKNRLKAALAKKNEKQKEMSAMDHMDMPETGKSKMKKMNQSKG